MFDVHRFEKTAFEAANRSFGHELVYVDARLTAATARAAAGCEAICAFVNDRLDASALDVLADEGVQLVALRSAGFNHVDLAAAAKLGIKVVRVPAYSPHAVAEHAALLVLALNRKICRANARVREHNFSLEGLVGFDLHGKTVGIVGVGRIGAVMAKIMAGFGCNVLAYDLAPSDEAAKLGVEYVSLDELYRRSDVVSLHVPLTDGTRHLVDRAAIAKMKRGVTLINTGRGALIDAKALIDGLKSGQIGAAGLDVYEEEESLFFQDLSEQVLQDDVLARLLTFPNALVTAHQAFLTEEALGNIATTTLQNVADFESGRPLAGEVAASAAGPRSN